MSLMGTQTKHDEIRVGSINAVTRVWIKIFLRSLGSDKIENFMFSFARNKRIGKYDLEVFPLLPFVESLNNIQHKCFRKTMHKLSTRSDDIGVKDSITCLARSS